MAGKYTTHMGREYVQEAPVAGVFSGMAQAPRENYYTAETFQHDIWREGEEVAPVVLSIKDGNTKFSLDEFTNKEFSAVVMSEEFSISAHELTKRQFGEIDYTDPVFRASAMNLFMKHMRYGGKRQRRTLELMASQVLQTATVTLKDEKGDDAYKIDFKGKPTHFPTFATAWTDHANATPIANIKALCDVINTDGQSKPKEVWLGDGAYDNMLQCDEFIKYTDTQHVKIINIEPRDVPSGATYMGTLVATGYRLDLYTYRGEYKDVGATTNSRFLKDSSVLVIAEGMRLDATFGAIPVIAPPEGRALSFLGGRIPASSVGLDFNLNAYLSLNGKTITGEIASKPLIIPTSIDRFGCGKAF